MLLKLRIADFIKQGITELITLGITELITLEITWVKVRVTVHQTGNNRALETGSNSKLE